MEIKKVAKIAEFQHKIEINIFVVLFYTLLYFTVLLYYYTPVLYCTVLYCTVLYYIYYITVLQPIWWIYTVWPDIEFETIGYVYYIIFNLYSILLYLFYLLFTGFSIYNTLTISTTISIKSSYPLSSYPLSYLTFFYFSYLFFPSPFPYFLFPASFILLIIPPHNASSIKSIFFYFTHILSHYYQLPTHLQSCFYHIILILYAFFKNIIQSFLLFVFYFSSNTLVGSLTTFFIAFSI